MALGKLLLGIDVSYEHIRSMLSAAVAGGVAGPLFTYLLRNWWLEKLKAKYAAELEEYKSQLEVQRNRLQSILDHRVFVHKAQFETEFDAMKGVFAAATRVWFALNGLRPMFDHLPLDDESRGKVLSERVTELGSAHNELIQLTESMRPFYPSELHELLQVCSQAARLELVQVRRGPAEALGIQGYLDAGKNQEEFSSSYARLAVAIRKRTEKVALISER